MSSNRIRWAVIGAGGIARRRTIPEGILASQNAQLVAIQSNANTAAVASQFNVPGFSNVGELLRCDCDAVYIATPVHLHLRDVEQAAYAGKHWDSGFRAGTAFMLVSTNPGSLASESQSRWWRHFDGLGVSLHRSPRVHCRQDSPGHLLGCDASSCVSRRRHCGGAGGI